MRVSALNNCHPQLASPPPGRNPSDVAATVLAFVPLSALCCRCWGAESKKVGAALAPLCASEQGVQRATPRLNREVTVAEQTQGEKSQFKTPMPQTPTTKILAVGTFAPGTDMSQVRRVLPAEVRETAQLYLDGKIDQWYSLEDRPGVVFILNMTDTQAAHAMLEELPLGKAHLMTFQLTPIGPLNPLRQLLVNGK